MSANLTGVYYTDVGKLLRLSGPAVIMIFFKRIRQEPPLSGVASNRFIARSLSSEPQSVVMLKSEKCWK